MSNLVTDGAEAWIKLQRKLGGGADGFYLSTAEYDFLNDVIDGVGAVTEAANIITAGPAALVEGNLTGPYRWSASVLLTTTLDVIATGDVVPTLVTDMNEVDSVTITEGGFGYLTAPAVTFKTAAGTTALGTAVLTNGVVTSVIVTEAGVYTDLELPITVTFAAAPDIEAATVITAGDETPAIVQNMMVDIQNLSPNLICKGAESANISANGFTIKTKSGADITLSGLALT